MKDEPQQRVGELLAAWRAEHDPGASERARMWTAIAARAGVDDPWVEESSAGAGVARAAVRPRLWIGAVAIAAAAVLAVAIAPRARELARTVAPTLQQSIRAVLPSLSRSPEPRALVPEPPAQVPERAALQPASVAVPPPAIAVAPVIEAPVVRNRTRREPPELASPASIDPAEVELLERAQRRLASDAAAALALFEQHAHDYPRSELAAERELGRADARCRSGDAAGARELVDRFTRSRSGSPLLARMRSICAEQAP
jgi:hypothetical protein